MQDRNENRFVISFNFRNLHLIKQKRKKEKQNSLM